MSSSPVDNWVNILTPVYNGWEFLEECAQSIYLQKRGWAAQGAAEAAAQPLTWTWWIGINGHGLESAAVREARYVADMLPAELGAAGCSVRVLILPETVKGKAAAMNELFRAAAAVRPAPWVAVLDCDDCWEPGKLLVQQTVLEGEAAGADVVGSLCSYFGDWVAAGPNLPCGWLDPEAFRRENILLNSSCLIRTAALLEKGIQWEDRFVGLDDYDMWIRLAMSGAKFYNVPVRLLRHRLHGSSAFNGKGGQDVAGLLRWHYEAPAPAPAAASN